MSKQTPQRALFHDRIEDALIDDILAAGGYKTVGKALWPSITDPAAAGQKLRNCLNATQGHKLELEEVLKIKALAHVEGSHATITYEGQHLGFRVEWLKPEDERAQLQRDFIDSVQESRRILDRMEKLTAPSLKAVG